MSFRNTFVTDYIYQASGDVIKANDRVEQAFKQYCTLSSVVDERGYGYYAGLFKTYDGQVNYEEIESMLRELKQATKVPFRLTILMESGPQLTYEITP